MLLYPYCLVRLDQGRDDDDDNNKTTMMMRGMRRELKTNFQEVIKLFSMRDHTNIFFTQFSPFQ